MRRSGWVIAGCIFMSSALARGDAAPYEPGIERAFNARYILLGMADFPDWVFVQFPAPCAEEFRGDDEDAEADERARLNAPAPFAVLEGDKVLPGRKVEEPRVNDCDFYAIDRRGFTRDVVVALKSMTDKERRLFFETDPRAHKAGRPTDYQVVERGDAEIGLKEEFRAVMTKEGPDLVPARQIWTLRGGKTRTDDLEVPAPEPAPPPATPPAAAPPETTPVSPPEPPSPADPPRAPASPVDAAPTPAPVVVAAAPQDPALPNRSWLIMVGGFAVFAVLSGFFLLRRR